jgi:hypothetical protein
MPDEAKTVFENLLQSDFEQCFEQMRHYDDVFQNSLQFVYTGVVAVAGASGTLFSIWGTKTSNLATLSFILLFSWVAGIVVVMELAKNRVYFARVARYVNEIRDVYLDKKPAGVTNKAKMFTDPTFPHVLDLGSTQIFQVGLASVFDSLLFGFTVVALFAFRNVAHDREASPDWSSGIWACVAFLVVEFGLVIVYWLVQESNMKPSE